MQNDIYNILPKHFAGQTTPEEEKHVDQFKTENNFEYQQLKKLWISRKTIRVYDFDKSRAWKIIKEVQKRQNTKTIPMDKRWMRVAVVAAILIVGSLMAYQYLPSRSKSEILIVSSSSESQMITLADGSNVWLNRNSTLHFPKVFKGEKRAVQLEGEAFFDIQKNDRKEFIIETANAFTKVLGTSFNIIATETQTDVMVETGKVEVSNHTAQKIVLTAGEAGQVGSNKVEKLKQLAPNAMAWRTGEFTFKDTPLSQAVKDLNTYYVNQFMVENLESGCELNVNFKRAKIEDIIETIELLCGVEFSKKGNRFGIQ